MYLQALSDSLPADAELVVGFGGGRALDASKYVALTKDLPLILVPTVVSTGAIIHSTVAKWSGRMLIGPGDRWPWVDPGYGCSLTTTSCWPQHPTSIRPA